MKKSVSIIIPNYNGLHLLKEYLPFTIITIGKQQVPFEIIVVDDASEDESVAYLMEYHPEVIILRNDENCGFAKSCNRALDHVRYELTLILNSDIRLSPGYFDPLWKYFRHEDTFGVMGRILKSDGKETEIAAKSISLKGLRIKSGRQFWPAGQSQHRTPTLFLSGANALVSTAKIKELDGFDEIFSPYYFEDFDLSLRAWKLGWKSYYEHQSQCYHLGSHTINRSNQRKKIKTIYFKNRMILNRLHLPVNFPFLLHLQILVLEVVPKAIAGNFWIMDSYREFMKKAREISKSIAKQEKLMGKKSLNLSINQIRNEIRKGLKLATTLKS